MESNTGTLAATEYRAFDLELSSVSSAIISCTVCFMEDNEEDVQFALLLSTFFISSSVFLVIA